METQRRSFHKNPRCEIKVVKRGNDVKVRVEVESPVVVGIVKVEAEVEDESVEVEVEAKKEIQIISLLNIKNKRIHNWRLTRKQLLLQHLHQIN